MTAASNLNTIAIGVVGHYGRTAKFGVWMQGPDYTQWHGAYEVVKGLVELQALAAEKKGHH